LIARAYALSERESEICLLVMSGMSTANISQRLQISRNTIQDHLNALFDKVGARSRREPVSHIFHAHCRTLQLEPSTKVQIIERRRTD
jgi:DNA-binding CsgD family transcriptional regulator